MKKRILLVLILVAIFVVPMLPTTNYTYSQPQQKTVFTISGGNYKPPPVGHFNFFAPGFLGGLMDWVLETLTDYVRVNDTYLPGLATNWTLSPDYMVFKVTLRKGVKWHDGREFTAKDVIATWYSGIYLRRDRPWYYLKNITVVDDYHLIFYMKEPNDYVPFYVLWHYNIVPYSQYGQFSDKVLELIGQGYDIFKNPEKFEPIRKALMDYRPEKFIGTGPYKLKKITDTEIILEKFEDYWSGPPEIDEVRLVRITSNDIYWSMVLSGKIDWYWGTPTPETLDQLKSKPFAQIVKIRRPLGPLIYFNYKKYPLNIKEVRQAFAYAINRTELAWIQYPIGGIPEDYMVGYSTLYMRRYLNDSFINTYVTKFRYDYDPKKAEELLQGLGFKKGSDGVYVTSNGTRLEFQLVFDGWLSAPAAEALANQLTKVGIKLNLRNMGSGAYWASDGPFYQGRYDIAIGVFASPGFSFEEFFYKYRVVYPGNHFPDLWETPWTSKPVNVTELIRMLQKYPVDVTEAERNNAMALLTWITGNYVPVISLFETPIIIYVNKEKFTGWPSPEDMDYWNSLASYAAHGRALLFKRHIVKPYMFLTVQVEPAEGGTLSLAPGEYKYAKGAKIQITAQPKSGYKLDKWILDGKEVKGPTITITMDSPHTVKAVFVKEQPPYALYAGIVVLLVIIVVAVYLYMKKKGT